MNEIVFDYQMHNLLLFLCRVSTTQRQEKLINKLRTMQNLTPEAFSVSKFCRLDASSDIDKIFKRWKKVEQGSEGDVGGSSDTPPDGS